MKSSSARQVSMSVKERRRPMKSLPNPDASRVFGQTALAQLHAPQQNEKGPSNPSKSRVPLRDVPKPKRPRTAYNLFFRDCQEKINAIRLYNPNASRSASDISQVWQELPAIKRAVYVRLATEDKFRYYQEKEAYEEYIECLKQRVQEEDEAEIVRDMRVSDSMPEDWRVPEAIDVSHDRAAYEEDLDPTYSSQAIALLASKLDQQSIDFLVKVLK